MEGERKEVRACAKILQTGRMSRKIQGWVELGERMRMVAVAGVGRVRDGERGKRGEGGWLGERGCELVPSLLLCHHQQLTLMHTSSSVRFMAKQKPGPLHST